MSNLHLSLTWVDVKLATSFRDINTKESSLRHICVVHFSLDISSRCNDPLSQSGYNPQFKHLNRTRGKLNEGGGQTSQYKLQSIFLLSKCFWFLICKLSFIPSSASIGPQGAILVWVWVWCHQPMGAQCDGSLTNQSWLNVSEGWSGSASGLCCCQSPGDWELSSELWVGYIRPDFQASHWPLRFWSSFWLVKLNSKVSLTTFSGRFWWII